jgi:hypothetical protein
MKKAALGAAPVLNPLSSLFAGAKGRKSSPTTTL